MRPGPASTAPFGFVLLAFAAAAAVYLAYYTKTERLALSAATFVTGWTLLGAMTALGLFNIRKRFSAFPIGRAAYWLALHVVLGLFAVAMFVVHTGGVWATGFYEQLLAGGFWATALSGLFGWLYQRAVPRRLARIGYEVVYERVPAELADLRDAAEKASLDGVAASGQPTLGRFYSETLQAYFQRPRFQLSHLLGTGAAGQWIDQRFDAVSGLIGGGEQEAFDALKIAARRKAQVDAHYALQRSLKLWVAVHVVLTSATLTLAVWHLILVYVYAR